MIVISMDGLVPVRENVEFNYRVVVKIGLNKLTYISTE